MKNLPDLDSFVNHFFKTSRYEAYLGTIGQFIGKDISVEPKGFMALCVLDAVAYTAVFKGPDFRELVNQDYCSQMLSDKIALQYGIWLKLCGKENLFSVDEYMKFFWDLYKKCMNAQNKEYIDIHQHAKVSNVVLRHIEPKNKNTDAVFIASEFLRLQIQIYAAVIMNPKTVKVFHFYRK